MTARQLIEAADFSGQRACDLDDAGIDPYVPGWAAVGGNGTMTFADGTQCQYILLRHGQRGHTEGYYCVQDKRLYPTGYMIEFNARAWNPFKIDTSAITAPTTCK